MLKYGSAAKSDAARADKDWDRCRLNRAVPRRRNAPCRHVADDGDARPFCSTSGSGSNGRPGGWILRRCCDPYATCARFENVVKFHELIGAPASRPAYHQRVVFKRPASSNSSARGRGRTLLVEEEIVNWFHREGFRGGCPCNGRSGWRRGVFASGRRVRQGARQRSIRHQPEEQLFQIVLAVQLAQLFEVPLAWMRPLLMTATRSHSFSTPRVTTAVSCWPMPTTSRPKVLKR